MAVRVGIEPVNVAGGPHDAFSHAYVSARLTIRLGSNLAESLGKLNERFGSEAAGRLLEAEMDHHNNAVGRAIARRLIREGRTTRLETARSVRAELDSGELRVIRSEERGDPVLVPSGDPPG